MGYNTDFSGEVNIVPPLNSAEIAYLLKFNGTRRMNCAQGPYYVERGGDYGQDYNDGVLDFNNPPAGQPGLWCQWIPNEDGTALVWDENEKFYESVEWMRYLVEHFLKPGAIVLESISVEDFGLDGFTFDHVLNGEIYAQGEDHDDQWRLVVKDNIVKRQQGVTVYDES